jgi:hypothetical protein
MSHEAWVALNRGLRERCERLRQEQVQRRVAESAAKTHARELVAALSQIPDRARREAAASAIPGFRWPEEAATPAAPDPHVHAEQSPEPASQQWDPQVVERAGEVPPNYRRALVMMLRQDVTDADGSLTVTLDLIGKWAGVTHHDTIRQQIGDLVKSEGRRGTRFRALGLKVAKYLADTGHR